MTITVLVVDDSALMRRQISTLLTAEGDIQTVTARDGVDALAQIARHPPDVITLDINMPVMDGLTCLSHIMRRFPTPVIMLSSLTEHGALATFEALALGAVDYVSKPGGTVSLNIDQIGDELRQKVRAAARSQAKVPAPTTSSQRRPSSPAPPAPAGKPPQLVIIGVSTGGPSAVQTVLSALPKDFALPIIVAQHMPQAFTAPFARRLDQHCRLPVSEVGSNEVVQPGQVYVARGDADVRLVNRGGQIRLGAMPANPRVHWHPSISLLVASARQVYADAALITVQLTGMGNDGAAEMAAAHRGGALTIAESEQTAAVFGMPRALIEEGGASKVLPRDQIAAQLVAWSTPALNRAGRSRGLSLW